MDITVLASGSKGNCYHVTDGSTPLLLECGIPYKQIQQKLNFQTSSIAGALITHEHLDHAKSVKDVMKSGINCYLTQGTLDAVGVVGHRAKVIAPKQQFNVGTWEVLPFDVQHDAAEPVGFLLMNQAGKKLLYATDTYYLRYRFSGLTHIMIECNYSLDLLNANVENGSVPAVLKNRLLRSHMSIETAKGFLRANDLSKVQEIHLIHLSDGNSDAERFKREMQSLTGKMVFIA